MALPQENPPGGVSPLDQNTLLTPISLSQYVRSCPDIPHCADLRQLYPYYSPDGIDVMLSRERKRRKEGGEIIPLPVTSMPQQMTQRREVRATTLNQQQGNVVENIPDNRTAALVLTKVMLQADNVSPMLHDSLFELAKFYQSIDITTLSPDQQNEVRRALDAFYTSEGTSLFSVPDTLMQHAQRLTAWLRNNRM